MNDQTTTVTLRPRVNYIIIVHTEVQFGIIIILASLYYDYNGDDQINFKGSLQIMISTS